MDTTTDYLDMKLKSPIVASASPLTESVPHIRQLEDAGAGAVVLHSLFEEQIQMESHDLDFHLSNNAESYAEALSYFPEQDTYKLGPDSYLELIRQAKELWDLFDQSRYSPAPHSVEDMKHLSQRVKGFIRSADPFLRRVR